MTSALAIEFRAEANPEGNEDEDDGGVSYVGGRVYASLEEEEVDENFDPSLRSTEDGVGTPVGILACREADRSISAANGEINGLWWA